MTNTHRMTRLVALGVAGMLAGCDPGADTRPDDPDILAPGQSVSLASLVSEAAGGATVTWSVDPGGGSINQAGLYTAPTCAQMIAALGAPDIGAVGLITSTDTVHAVWDGGSMDVSVSVAERVLGVAITPTDPSTTPGGVIQFQVEITYTCHTQVG